MKKLKEERHILLYAKGWYKRTNLLKDLTKIVEHITGLIYVGKIPRSAIWYWVTKVFIDLVPECQRNDFWQRELFQWNELTITREIVIKKILGELSTVPCLDDNENVILDIGKPDYTILPKKK